MSADYLNHPIITGRFIVVPWYNADQFRKVYEYAYSNELVKKRWAYDTISVWETRCYPSLPAAIESTYVLLGAIIQDILWHHEASFVNHSDLQSIYGSAVTRFVNLMVEAHKNQRKLFSQSATELARGLGIPSFIVTIRNEWCHSSRPSLAVFRIAAEHAMNFLKETFWIKQIDKIKNYVKKPLDNTKLSKILYDYVYTQFLYFSEKKHDDIDLKRKRQVATSKCKEKIQKDKRRFIKALMPDGIFIPTDDNFRDFLSKEECMEWSPESDTSDDDDDDDDTVATAFSCHDLKYSVPCIPKLHELIWSPVIALLNTFDAVPIFLEYLLKSQGDRTIIGQKLTIAWISKILSLNISGGRHPFSPLKKVFRSKGLVANWRCIFYSALINPCKYTMYIIPLIFCHLDLKEDVTVHIISLLAAQLGQIKDESLCHRDYKTFTLEDLKQMYKLQVEKRVKQKKKLIEKIWSLCSDDHYNDWPIGYVINNEKEMEEETLQDEDDLMDCFMEEPDYTKAKFHCNENGKTDDSMDDDRPKLPDFEKIKEVMRNKTNFLYKK